MSLILSSNKRSQPQGDDDTIHYSKKPRHPCNAVNFPTTPWKFWNNIMIKLFFDYIHHVHNLSQHSSESFQFVESTLDSMCELYFGSTWKLIGFKPTTQRHHYLSRYNSFDHSDRSHIMVLLKRNDGLLSHTMLSVVDRQISSIISQSNRILSEVECIDIHRVRRIRFLIWLVKCLKNNHNLGDAFLEPWYSIIIPLSFNNNCEKVPELLNFPPGMLLS